MNSSRKRKLSIPTSSNVIKKKKVDEVNVENNLFDTVSCSSNSDSAILNNSGGTNNGKNITSDNQSSDGSDTESNSSSAVTSGDGSFDVTSASSDSFVVDDDDISVAASGDGSADVTSDSDSFVVDDNDISVDSAGDSVNDFNNSGDENEEISSSSDDDHNAKKKVKNWAIKRKLPQSHLDDLLQILRDDLNVNVPKSSKTFLGTTKATYEIEEMQDHSAGFVGQFAYCGIKKNLKKYVDITAHSTDTLDLQFHCDGLSLSKSSSLAMWPLLCRVYHKNINYEPFVVAVYCGRSKPNDASEYLAKFICELNQLLAEGVVISGKHFRVKINCIIADTPARAFLKGIVGHAGAHACERCRVVGRSINNCMLFIEADEDPRTDESFRAHEEEGHRVDASAFTFITPPINMISTFVLDFMHLGFLGVMKKLLGYWFLSGSRFKVSAEMKLEVSRRLKLIAPQVPHDFQRKTRELLELSNYKATEYKFFAFYAGPVILKDILPKDQYDHFLLFHHGSRLLWCSKTAINYVNIVRNIFQLFFMKSKLIYGKQSSSINMHNMIHVCDDIENTGLSLSEINAFVFESYLGKIKRLLRSPTHKVAQLCRRLHEELSLNIKATLKKDVKILKETRNGIRVIKFKGKILSVNPPDNMVLLKNKYIIEIKKIYKIGTIIYIDGLRWKTRDDIYRNEMFTSGQHDSWEIQNRSTSGISFSLDKVDNKMVRFDLNLSNDTPVRVFVLPLLHEE